MAIAQDAIQVYLESTLGVKADLETAKGLKAPFYIKDAYELLYLQILVGKKQTALSMLLLLPSENEYPGAVTLGKHIAQVRKISDLPVVFVCQSLSPAERRSLIAGHINFIQPGYQMFIPELALDLRESVRTRRSEEEITSLLPAAQAMLLGCLYQGWESDTIFTSNGIMGPYKYSRVTLAKVIDQLLKLHIIHPAQSRGFTNTYSFTHSPAEVFEKYRHLMRSPVKRRVAIDRVLHNMSGIFIAGETALSKITMLAGPKQAVFGMTKKTFDAMAEDNQFQMTDSVDEIRAWVEIWSYRSLAEDKHMADEASLLLSLEDNPDQRVQLALDELKENATWLKS